MLPSSSPISSANSTSPEELHTLQEPPENHQIHRLAKTSFITSLKTHISSHPRFCLLTAFLLPQVLILCIPFRSAISNKYRFFTPFSSYIRDFPSIAGEPECGLGRVYVYDLPAMFTKDLVLYYSCDDNGPRAWQCGMGHNDGYGKSASELAGILPEHLVPAWYGTNQYSLELIFHRRILKYRCRTLEPGSATAFYVPFYAGLAVAPHLLTNDLARRDYHGEMLVEWHRIKYRGKTATARITSWRSAASPEISEG